jgi:F420H(2)-dependent quinone reductase
MPVGRTLQRGFTRCHCTLYRATGGTIGAHLRGGPVLLLRTTGRRTGRRRETPLLYFDEGDRYVVVASNGGAPNHPCWFLNLCADPDVEIQVGAETHRLRARPAAEPERDELWERVTGRYPGYLHYQERTERRIPVVVLEPR